MDIVNSISIPTVFLLIWLQTEAFLYYAKLLKLTKMFKIDIFENDKLNDFTLEYPTWLPTKYPGFFTKLISCPWCIGFWVSFGICIALNTFYIFPTMYLCSIIIYFIIVNKLL